jgi:peptidoglycan/xylan/chitin deacetylase (PgdA/CDA1 family)
MIRAFAVKGLAIVAGVGVIWALPSGWAAVAVFGIAAATIGFFTYAIAHPSSQFFAPVVSRLPADRPVVALTFDDGPDPVFTPQILDVLGARRARATFFVLGERAARHPELIRRMHREGHAVGTHTQRHRLRFHFGSASYVQREIDDAVAVVADLLPVRPRLFRPPQGLRTPCRAWSTGCRPARSSRCTTAPGWAAGGIARRPSRRCRAF